MLQLWRALVRPCLQVAPQQQGPGGPARPAFSPYGAPRRPTGALPPRPGTGALPVQAPPSLPPRPVAGAQLDTALPWADEAAPLAGGRQLAALEHAKEMLAGTQEVMGLMHRNGQQASEDYRDLVQQYKDLAGAIQAAKTALSQSAPVAAEAPAEAPPAPAEPARRFPSLTVAVGPPGKGMSSGPAVRLLQEMLGELGFPAQVTGQYDVKTFNAVKEFQARHGHKVTGIVGSETRAALNNLCGGGS